MLSRNDVASIHPAMRPIINVWLHSRTAAAMQANRSTRIDSDLLGGYGASVGPGNLSLGQFSIDLRGDVCCPAGISSCTFEGEFMLTDTYDFDWRLRQGPDDYRSGGGNFEVLLVWLFTTGHNFPVKSDWIPVSANGAGPATW